MPRAFRGLHSRTLPQKESRSPEQFQELEHLVLGSAFSACFEHVGKRPVKLCLHVKLCINSDGMRPHFHDFSSLYS